MDAHALVAGSAVFRAKSCEIFCAKPCETLQGVRMAPAWHLPPSPDKCLSMLSGNSLNINSGQSLGKPPRLKAVWKLTLSHKVCLCAAIQGIKNSKAPVSNGVPVAA